MTWTRQELPEPLASAPLNFGSFGGTPYNVHFHSGAYPAAYITRFDGTSWSMVFTNSDIYGLTLVGQNEGYYVNCHEWGLWNGAKWQSEGYAPVGCDVYGGAWGLRDAKGALSLYAIGQNSWNNGVHIWGFDEASQAWNEVFSDGPGGAGTGNGLALWGTAANDVYAVGEVISGQADSGRVYHFDGAAWSQVTNVQADVGPIPRPGGVGGSAADNVWVSLADGRMLHYGPLSASQARLFAGLIVIGPPGDYRIDAKDSLGCPSAWTALETKHVTVDQMPFYYFDTNSPGMGKRFYRSVWLR